FQTYPPTNPFCTDAVAACHRALVQRTDCPRILLRVRPHTLVIDAATVGSDAVIEHGLARRLHRAHVAALAIDSTASPGDLSRFCRELVSDIRRDSSGATLAETLAERGVDRIVAVMAHRPEVLEVGVPDPQREQLLLVERRHRANAPVTGGGAAYLYPPDRGFVRLDPTVRCESVSLSDLAILVDDPRDLAAMLLRLTGDAGDRSDALERKFSDVATLFSSLSPNMARLMFSRLARAVLALDDERRAELLRRTILPGLLDGRVDGAVLRDFPDVDLVESLCLLLDLETAAPEVLASALDRLDLPPERLQAVTPLLEHRLQDRKAGSQPRSFHLRDLIERLAHRLVRLDASRETSFADFAAFDLSMDRDGRAGVAAIRDGIGATDALEARCRCLMSLIAIEPSPGLVDTLLRRLSMLLAELEQQERWQQLMSWIERCRQMAGALKMSRPEIADAISAALRATYTCDHVSRLRELHERDADGRDVVRAMMTSAGSEIVPAFVMLLDASPPQVEARSLIEMMSEHARLLAPALSAALGTSRPDTVRLLVRVLGHAGPGYEQTLASQLAHRDELTIREALRALTRVGTAQAAALVAAHVYEGPPVTRAAAEAALWRLPRGYALREVLRLLERPDFIRRHPGAAARVIDRAASLDVDAIRPVLRRLVPLRFCVWSRGLMRVGLTARRCLER
ncbi:MAG: hypothetical protein ACREKH_02080, partial [Candidatus Rokuibacteriota bacterium]